MIFDEVVTRSTAPRSTDPCSYWGASLVCLARIEGNLVAWGYLVDLIVWILVCRLYSCDYVDYVYSCDYVYLVWPATH